MQTRYLVTGAAGHLGNTVVQALHAQNKRVRALVMPHELELARRRLPQEAEIVTGNVCDPESLAPFFENAEGCAQIVIHAAGIVTITAKPDPRVYEVNVNGTRNIVNLCQQNRVAKLIYVSSVHAIPELPQGETIGEIDAFDPQKVYGAYAKTKAEATQIVLDAAQSGLFACVVHPAGILGPFDYEGRNHATQMVQDYIEGRLVACVRGGYDFVDVRDVAAGIIACSERGRSGECYILSNKYYPVHEIMQTLHEITGKPRVKTVLPLWFAKLTAPLAELYYKMLRQPPLFTRYSLYTLESNSLFSYAKAAKELNYAPRPLKESLADTVAWMQEQSKALPKKLGKLKRIARGGMVI